jgi:lauroyl/myristoyl acyltransferase
MDDDIRLLTNLIARRLNEIISRYPDQWLVFNAAWQ